MGLDILLLCETWITHDAPPAVKSDIAPPGYSVHRSMRKTTGRGAGRIKGGGGIAVIYRDNLVLNAISGVLGKFATFESLCVRITQEKKSLTLIGIYRPPPSPDSKFFDEIGTLLDAVDLLSDDVVICGDFNCPGVDKNSINIRLMQSVHDHNLQQFVTGSTRKQEGNILDLIIARLNGLVTGPIAINEVSFSDHNIVSFSVNVTKSRVKVQSFTYRDIKAIDLNLFANLMRKSSIFVAPPSTVDEFANRLEADVVAALDRVAPLKKRTKRVGVKSTARWITREVRNKKGVTRRRERRFKATRSNEDYVAYRRAGRAASKSVKAARTTFYMDSLTSDKSSADPRARWGLIKEVLHSDDRSKPGTSLDPLRLAQSFTSFFHDKLKKISSTITAHSMTPAHSLNSYPPLPTDNPAHLLSFAPVTPAEVDQLLRFTPPKSSSLDFIPTSMLKSCSSVFVPLITSLANLSFNQGQFPSPYKLAHVTPLLKKPTLDPAQPSSYRPISNLSSIGKILERLAMARLRPHITSCSNFSPRQSAYRPSHSCETMLLGLTNDLFTSIGNRRAQCLCTIDLSAAFDTVDHQILSERLKTDFGIGGEVALWLRSYFTNRSQIVRIGSAAADRTPLHMGVPQGSVLGPLLFTAYMSPISRIIERYGIRQHHYADDTTLYADVTDARDLPPPALTQCCEHLTAWCYANGMQINPDKSEVILFCSPSQLKKFDLTRPAVIAGTSVQFQRTVKIVGVTLDSSLSFDDHVSDVCKSCNYHIRALRHVRPMLSTRIANEVACSIVASRLDYCNSLLFNMSASNIGRLQCLQNNLARVVCNAPVRSSAPPLLHRLHWLPVEQRIKYKIVCITHNTLHSGTPLYLRQALEMGLR